jgi:hypothetical protein
MNGFNLSILVLVIQGYVIPSVSNRTQIVQSGLFQFLCLKAQT